VFRLPHDIHPNAKATWLSAFFSIILAESKKSIMFAAL
jgi:hypothetical protein